MVNRKNANEIAKTKGIPARSPDERERELMEMAFDRVESRIIDGTASAQELVYFMKLASQREALELKNLEVEIALKEARRDQIGSMEQQTELYEKALEAFTSYKGNDYED